MRETTLGWVHPLYYYFLRMILSLGLTCSSERSNPTIHSIHLAGSDTCTPYIVSWMRKIPPLCPDTESTACQVKSHYLPASSEMNDRDSLGVARMYGTYPTRRYSMISFHRFLPSPPLSGKSVAPYWLSLLKPHPLSLCPSPTALRAAPLLHFGASISYFVAK